MRIQTKTCKLEIHGAGLYISYYTNDEMKSGQAQRWQTAQDSVDRVRVSCC